MGTEDRQVLENLLSSIDAENYQENIQQIASQVKLIVASYPEEERGAIAQEISQLINQCRLFLGR